MHVRLITAVLLCLSLLGSPNALAGPALLFDPADGRILYGEDLDNQWHPASLTKIMTAYLAFEAIKEGKLTLNQKISYSELAAQQPPSKLGMAPTGTLLVESALKALIIKSANDVAIMLAEAISGSDVNFVVRMNETARRLGMTRTVFVNPNGLPAPEQVTTARDLAKLARAVMKEYPEYASYWSMNDARIGKIHIGTHNSLLNSFEGADGMKTGFICDSGFNVVASATRDGHQLMAVVLGESTGGERTVRAESLLEHGFQQYRWKALFDAPNIDTTPIEADAKDVTSIRQSVISIECGTGGRRAAARRAKHKGAKAKKARAADASIEAPASTATGKKTKSPPVTGAAAASESSPAAKTTPPPTQAATTDLPAVAPKPQGGEEAGPSFGYQPTSP